ncbi:hypothetical protein B0J13DRAFT_136123 [Dactylonectria estremocensis]|uniref:NYN domain-containing protein n=1 Tax=Dactylonectria estremocensis TaxID=1079267 RepID=A0A9P9DZN2_9HYPO|nr:hypothetical protein B0J13DRAFT_136123 [Dactylonectria estremocensis]
MPSNSTPTSRSRCSTPGSSKPPDSPKSSRGTKSRKLGDFAKLQALSSMTSSTLEQNQPSKESDSIAKVSPQTPCKCEQTTPAGPETPVTLGNFSKIFDRLSVSRPTNSSPDLRDTTIKAIPIKILKRASLPQSAQAILPSNTSLNKSTKQTSPKKASPRKSSSKTSSSGYTSNSSSGTGSGSDSDLEQVHSYSTPASTPPSSAERDPSPLAKFSRAGSRPPSSRSPKSKNCTRTGVERSAVSRPKFREQTHQILTYQHHKYGPITPVYGSVLSHEAKHESLANKLVTERVQDRILSHEKPNVESNGVHVFIDMSNISISFLKAVRTRFSLPESVRFTPLPSLDLSFLHELLVRGRGTKVLNAGCSIRPNRAEPTYIQELRNLGYRVDLRRRVDSQEVQTPAEMQGASGHPRYVEDMVDETLQIRIGESVMKYFDEPGTLILATGDAKPAKFSDGFFTYAERALKMGWNVEVVSWKASLSGAWTNPAWAKPWGDRFRVIELDGYLDDLLASYAS